LELVVDGQRTSLGVLLSLQGRGHILARQLAGLLGPGQSGLGGEDGAGVSGPLAALLGKFGFLDGDLASGGFLDLARLLDLLAGSVDLRGGLVSGALEVDRLGLVERLGERLARSRAARRRHAVSALERATDLLADVAGLN